MLELLFIDAVYAAEIQGQRVLLSLAKGPNYRLKDITHSNYLYAAKSVGTARSCSD